METKQAKINRTSSRKNFNKATTTLAKSIEDKECSAVLEYQVKEVQDTFEKLVSNNNQYLVCLDEESDEFTSASEKYLDEILKQKNDVLLAHARFKQKITQTKPKEEKTQQVNSQPSTSSNTTIKRKTLEIQPFTNRIRDYLPWKKRFTQYFQQQYGDVAGLVLKDALRGEAANLVRSIDDSDVEAIIAALDQRYGQEDKLINSVTDDLQILPEIHLTDPASLRQVLDSIEIARQDLAFANLEAEFEHFSTVKIIERKFSQEVKMEWAKYKSENGRPAASKLFTLIIKFLTEITQRAEDVKSMGPTTETIPVLAVGVPAPLKNPSSAREGKSDNKRNTKDRTTAKTCLLHGETSNHYTRNCRLLRQKSPGEQEEWFGDHPDVCRICLNKGHGNDGSRCKLQFKPCNREGCTKTHHPDYHEALAKLSSSSKKTSYASLSVNSDSDRKSTNFKHTISPAQAVEILNQNLEVVPVGILLDTGSVITLISNSVIQKAQLLPTSPHKYHITMETVGGHIKDYDALTYRITLKGQNGAKTTITALGVDNIGSRFPTIDMSAACEILDVASSKITYPSNRSLDILIGTDNAHLIMTTRRTTNGLIYAENVLGKLIYGTHESFAKDGAPTRYMVTGFWTAPSISDLFATDALGVECTPKCGSCKCGKCAPGSSNLTLKEEREYKIIRSGMKLEEGKVIANYPWIKDPKHLPDNYELAHKRLVQLENKLRRDPDTCRKYQEQVADMIERNVARKLTKEEDEAWRSITGNPIQYLPHHDVHRPESLSTPIRIVFDPSSRYKGHCVNEFWGTGPNLFLSSLGILVRFRENQTAVVSDVKKMYNTVYIGPKESHCHRFLWRDMDSTKDPDIYIIERNSFGSRPAAAVAIAALHLVAEAGEVQYPIGAMTIKSQTYVDDIVDSTVDKHAANELICQTEACLSLGSFETKGWLIVDARDTEKQNDTNHQTESKSSKVIGNKDETVLGLRWDTKTDSFFFIAKLNFSKRKKKLRQGPNLQKDEILTLPRTLTLRDILSQVNGFYDPMGLIGPYMVEMKFLLGKLWKVMNSQKNSSKIWDIPIPSDFDKSWKQLLNISYDLEDLRFPRHLKPDDTDGDPWLILFSDSSMLAFGSVAYIRWSLKNGNYWCRIIASKSRIWPAELTDRISICRGELQGAVLAKRLAKTIQNESRFKFAEVKYLIDSDIVRAQIADDGKQYDTFTGNRIGEILASTLPEQWYHIPGEQNVCADLLSRGSSSKESMSESSAWQRGPAFLYTPYQEWPVCQKYNSEEPLPGTRNFSVHQRTMIMQPQPFDIPEDWPWNEMCKAYSGFVNGKLTNAPKVVTTMFSDQVEQAIEERINIRNISKLLILLGVTYRTFHALAWKSGDGNILRYMTKLKVVEAEHLEQAMQFWIRRSQQQLQKEIKKGKFNPLKPTQEEGTRIWRLNGRFGEHPQGYHPIILPSDHPFVILLVTAIHKRGHNGATATAAKVKEQYHVLQIKKLSKKIRKSCILCRRLTKQLLKAPMAPLPTERFRPAYPFEHSSCDLFGNFLLKVPGKATRSRAAQYHAKGKGLIITCLSTRAVHLEVMEGEDTSAFLLAFRRFISIRGQPRYMWSDNGGQIVAADTELKNIVSGWDQQQLQEFGAHNGIKWQYIAPGSPWMNGVSEALIASVKYSLASIWQSKPRVPVMELQTILYEISALLNERPINLGHDQVPDDWDSDTNVYLCPNQLLLGRSTVRIPAGPYGVSASSHAEQFHNVQTIVNEWWERWSKHYLTTLLPQSKWHSMDRTVQVADICFVRDTNPVRGQWSIAEVIRADPSSDGVVRQVELRYKSLPEKPLETYTGVPDKNEVRHVKNLVIILTAQERNRIK